MKDSIIHDLKSDSRFALEQIFIKIYCSILEWENSDFHNLKLEYMVDDYDDYLRSQLVVEE